MALSILAFCAIGLLLWKLWQNMRTFSLQCHQIRNPDTRDETLHALTTPSPKQQQKDYQAACAAYDKRINTRGF